MTEVQEAVEQPPARHHFLHNVVAHPLLWAWPRLGRWIHDRTEP